MGNSVRVASYEYKNAFLYIILRQAPEHGPRSFLFCSGINLTRFSPLSRGTFGICSNPAFKGLQLLRADVAAFCRKKGVVARAESSPSCAVISPKGDGWYREESLVIETAPEGFPRELLRFSVTTLLRTVLSVCAPEVKLPSALPTPPKLQAYLESLGTTASGR